MIKIPHSYPDLDPRDAAALKQCIDSEFVGWDQGLEKVLGRHIQKFVHQKHVVVTSSGSVALIMALRALGVKPGDQVLMPAIDCWSVYNAITFLGAVPVLCDVRNTNDFRASFKTMAQKVTKNTKVAIVTHMLGVLVEEEDIRRLKKNLGLRIIEDYASSFGALYANLKPVGRYADFVIGSFGSTKPITSGAGGFLAGNKISWADADSGPGRELVAVNCRISSLNQRLLERQLARFGGILEKKRKLKELFARFVKIWGHESHGLYRAVTFDDVGPLKKFFKSHGFDLDIRQSVQPNLAQELRLKLPHAKCFEKYSSLPFHSSFVQKLALKGLL